MIKVLKWFLYLIVRPLSWLSLDRKIIVLSSANFGFNGQAKSNYNYISELFGSNNVVFLNASGVGFGVPLKSFKGLLYLFFSKKYIVDGVLPFFISLINKSVIQTWHGIPVKAIGCYEKTTKSKLEKKFVNWLLYQQWKSYKAIISPSESYSKIIRASFLNGIETHNIYNSLLPQQLELLKQYEKYQGDTKKVIKTILYVPTYRERDDRKWDLMLNKSFIKYCKEQNIKLIVKYHPLDCSFIRLESENIYYSQNEDLYNLLFSADLIVTDYSSIIFDCVLLNKRISLYCVDLEDYKNTRGFSDESELHNHNLILKEDEYLSIFNENKKRYVRFTDVQPIAVLDKIGWI
jgi:CDP-glycerol glycerophosphotransferase (TagB/SpsB family)